MNTRYQEFWMFFTPDHGQNLGGKEGLFNDGYSAFIVHNPLIVFSPQKYHANVLSNENAAVSQIDVFSTILEIMNALPMRPVDGISLLHPIPADRFRICSEYMPTFHNNPTAMLFFPDIRHYFIDFTKKSVLLSDDKNVMHYDRLDSTLRRYIEKKMH
jgi:arylsulfatase A-like enzyme